MQKKLIPLYYFLLIGIIIFPSISFTATTFRVDMDANTPGLQTEIQATPGQSFTTNIEIVLDGANDSISSFGYSISYDAGELNIPVIGDISTSPLASGWTDLGYFTITSSEISNSSQVNIIGSAQGPLTSIIATINWIASNPGTDSSADIMPVFHSALDVAYDKDGNSFTPTFQGGTVNIISPVVMIANILNYFDESVSAGTLEGRGKSSEKRLNAMRKLLVDVSTLIEKNNIERACKKLRQAESYSDGQSKPRDLVVGEAVPTLNSMIQQLMVNLGCE